MVNGHAKNHSIESSKNYFLSVSNPHSLNQDPAKKLNPDPSFLITAWNLSKGYFVSLDNFSGCGDK